MLVVQLPEWVFFPAWACRIPGLNYFMNVSKQMFEYLSAMISVKRSEEDSLKTIMGRMATHASKDSDEQLTHLDLVRNSALFIVAGTDTTAATLAWSMLFLSLYPEW